MYGDAVFSGDAVFPGVPSSLSDSLASGTRFTTVLSDGEDVEDSGEDASENSSRTSAEPDSILSRLKAANRSGLCRIAVNQSRKLFCLEA